MAPYKAAISELIGAAKASSKKLVSFMTAAPVVSAGIKKCGRKATESGGAVSVWELAPNHGSPIACIAVADWKPETMIYTEPAIIQFPPTDPIFKSGEVVTDAIAAFNTKFATSAARASDGRAQRPVKAEVQTAMEGKMRGLNPASDLVDIDKITEKDLKQSMSLNTFGIARNHETATCEVGHFSSFRLTFDGTRSIVFARALDVVSFLESLGEGRAAITPVRVYQFLKSATNETLAKFVDGNPKKLVHGTVGPKECLFTPCGWAFAERTLKNSEVLGMRWTFMATADKDTYQQLAEWLTTAKKTQRVLAESLGPLDFEVLIVHVLGYYMFECWGAHGLL